MTHREMGRRANVKLQEFVAHSSDVTCLQIGRKSGQVLVTGGEDKMVNMWRLGKHTNIMSLSGHSSAIESVAFDPHEEVVAAGSPGPWQWRTPTTAMIPASSRRSRGGPSLEPRPWRTHTARSCSLYPPEVVAAGLP